MPVVDLSPSPPRRDTRVIWASFGHQPSMIGPDAFRFLNHEARLVEPGDWNSAGPDLLWRYHLHYFDDLNAADSVARRAWHRALIERWLADNPPGQGVGWDPYPTSLRLVNWIKWLLAGQTLDEAMRQSLAVQARWLHGRLEIHLLGNHLWANAKALVFCGVFFQGEEAASWLATGLGLLRRELREQILKDGGHFERSPMYHALMLEDLLDLIQLAACFEDCLPAPDLAEWRESATSMLRWLRAMTHPDGGIAFFNDAVNAQALAPKDLEYYAASLNLGGDQSWANGLLVLESTGYVRAETAEVTLIMDVGEVGPDYIPGHAHADTLSFELSLFGKRFIVNSGIDRYGVSAERLRQRGTAAHSTVVVDDENSSEVWSSFRVARRARPFGLEVRECNGSQRICCSHDGYRRLNGKVVHRRCWQLEGDTLTIWDRLEGQFDSACARYHFHPAVEVEFDDSGRYGRARFNDQRVVELEVSQGEGRLVASSYHPEFGLKQENVCLEIAAADSKIELKLTTSAVATP